MSDGTRATPRQVAFIERLFLDRGATIEKPVEDLSMQEASELIDALLQKGSAASRKKESWSTGARIGLAFKVCYQRWIGTCTNIFKNNDRFIKNVLEAYELLNEIARRAEAT